MVVAHIILGYFISSGLLTRMVDVALPKAVIVNFVETPHEKRRMLYCAQGRARGPAAAAAPAPGAGPGGTGRTASQYHHGRTGRCPCCQGGVRTRPRGHSSLLQRPAANPKP
ncbi:hypothetical protein LP419_22950 [Massilia sp. H-1]|nr:hypothetical protein LP419_22950 [Massilia sp. H-1]